MKIEPPISIIFLCLNNIRHSFQMHIPSFNSKDTKVYKKQLVVLFASTTI